MVLIPCHLEEDPEAVLMLQICLKKIWTTIGEPFGHGQRFASHSSGTECTQMEGRSLDV